MQNLSKQDIIAKFIDELRTVNRALGIGGNLALTEKDFEYIGTLDIALRRDEGKRVIVQEELNLNELFI